MTESEIKKIIQLTIDELIGRQLINPDTYQAVLKVIEPELMAFFNNKTDNRIGRILMRLSSDPYIDIIFLQYRDGITLEKIAEYMRKDVSTIKRNKKRLMLSIYELWEGLL